MRAKCPVLTWWTSMTRYMFEQVEEWLLQHMTGEDLFIRYFTLMMRPRQHSLQLLATHASVGHETGQAWHNEARQRGEHMQMSGRPWRGTSGTATREVSASRAWQHQLISATCLLGHRDTCSCPAISTSTWVTFSALLQGKPRRLRVYKKTRFSLLLLTDV